MVESDKSDTLSYKHKITLLGQTPPPWHGQAVATQILFDHDWPEFDVDCVRMDYSEDMDEVGRFQIKKLARLVQLIIRTRRSLSRSPETVLLYPPASAKWVPFLRDVIFLISVRGKAARTVFIFHASGLAEFTQASSIRKWLAELAYHGADMALEVAEEKIAPHQIFAAKRHLWCPCGIEVPALPRKKKTDKSPAKVLFVGSLQEGKGVLEVMKTAACLRERGQIENFRFDIVGRWMNSAFEKEALAMHEELGLGDFVRFPGQLTGDEKWQAYAESDIFFFPSHYPSEASPIVLMEALGAGLPVISTLWNGIPALMRGCETATLLPIKSPEDYADALIELRNNPEEPGESSAKSVRFYEEHFLPERFVERVKGAFLDVAPQPAHQASQQDYPASFIDRLKVSVYLADQNPGHDRSLGISRMSEVVLNEMVERDDMDLSVISSMSSQQGPEEGTSQTVLPWGTRSKAMRVMTDHLHPILAWFREPADVWYFPKGFLPKYSLLKAPTVITVHDTIIQHYWDHYPGWRKHSEYFYWEQMLKSTLRNADAIFTVSENSKASIRSFMDRQNLPKKEILVTYEPCFYERYPQVENPKKGNYVIHLASREPHKRTQDLIRWWAERSRSTPDLPMLELIGYVPPESEDLIAAHSCFNRRDFLKDEDLRKMISAAHALILPSEVEGFGLPAIEGYYLGTPVCFTAGTSIEEILEESTSTGAFHLDDPATLWEALDQVLAMPASEVQRIGLELRERFATSKVVERMAEGFQKVARRG